MNLTLLIALQDECVLRRIEVQTEHIDQFLDELWIVRELERLGHMRFELVCQPGVILHYLRLAELPVGQCFDYALPVAREVAAIAGVWFAPQASFLAGCCFLVLAPTSSIVPLRDPCVEHRMYLPLAALVVGAVVSAYYGLLRNQPATRMTNAGRVLFGLCLLLGLLMYLRNRDYTSDVTLWADTLNKAPHNS